MIWRVHFAGGRWSAPGPPPDLSPLVAASQGSWLTRTQNVDSNNVYVCWAPLLSGLASKSTGPAWLIDPCRSFINIAPPFCKLSGITCCTFFGFMYAIKDIFQLKILYFYVRTYILWEVNGEILIRCVIFGKMFCENQIKI